MPKPFTECVKKGGKVFTVKISKDKYRYGCTIGGKTSYGEIHTKKTKKK